MKKSGIFLDYQVIDHLHRLANRCYQGSNLDALHAFSVLALSARFDFWMARITQVEMLMGRENPKIDVAKLSLVTKKDEEKLAIAERFGVGWLEYPCSKLDDEYSRWDITFACDGCPRAAAFEASLEAIPGVSRGDARQVVSLTHGHALIEGSCFSPIINWFITEDQPLHTALNNLVRNGNVAEISRFEVCSVPEFIETLA